MHRTTSWAESTPGIGSSGVGRDLPQVAVRVAEVAVVAGPLRRLRLAYDGAAGILRLLDDGVDSRGRVNDVMERHPAETITLGVDTGVLRRGFPFVEREGGRTDAERHEVGIVLGDLCAELRVELLGAREVLHAEHDGGHLQTHSCLLRWLNRSRPV